MSNNREAVRKGEIRNTVLHEIKTLEKACRLLDQGRGIKKDEVEEFKSTNKPKAKKLRKQINIISQGLRHLAEAVKILEKYKETSSTMRTALFDPIQEEQPSRSWRDIQAEYETKFGANHHCLNLECIKCGGHLTCRCSSPKTLEKGVCYYCTGELERPEPLVFD